MQAALDVFADRGFHGASIENICEKAGFTRGAFYSNFAGKDELFFTLFDASSEQLLTQLRAALDECRKSPDPLSTFIRTIDDKGPTQRRWYLISMEFTLYAIREPSAAVVLAEHDARLRREAAGIINELMSIAHRELIIDTELIADSRPPCAKEWPRSSMSNPSWPRHGCWNALPFPRCCAHFRSRLVPTSPGNYVHNAY
ncbi:Putative TetR-family regulatory protein [Mycobacteroides abscessus]|nr:Putative TetR-family regulatory protein [Mycobacteroides abscessus]